MTFQILSDFEPKSTRGNAHQLGFPLVLVLYTAFCRNHIIIDKSVIHITLLCYSACSKGILFPRETRYEGKRISCDGKNVLRISERDRNFADGVIYYLLD